MPYDPYLMSQIHAGDAGAVLDTLPSGIAHTAICSPPYYGLRDYGVAGQIGLELSLREYLAALVSTFERVKRVLRPDGTLWVNIGDTYRTSGGAGWQGKNGVRIERRHTQANIARTKLKIAGLDFGPDVKPKDAVMVPAQFALAMRAAGWFLRADIIWHKPNKMPSSQKDRPTVDHEYIFLFAKRRRYYYDADAIAEPSIKEPGKTRSKRTVWSVSTRPYRGAHFATYPPQLVEPCVLAGCPLGGLVIDPFCGAASTGLAAIKHGRRFLGIELNPDNASLSRDRLNIYLRDLVAKAS